MLFIKYRIELANFLLFKKEREVATWYLSAREVATWYLKKISKHEKKFSKHEKNFPSMIQKFPNIEKIPCMEFLNHAWKIFFHAWKIFFHVWKFFFQVFKISFHVCKFFKSFQNFRKPGKFFQVASSLSVLNCCKSQLIKLILRVFQK